MEEDDDLWIFDDIECEEVQLECEEDDSVYVKLHGGGCCGFKHIHNMGSGPDEMLSSRIALIGVDTSYNRNAVAGVNDAHADTYPEDFFCNEAPQETRGARLDRIVTFLKDKRPHGIVEIILTTAQKDGWKAGLEARGWVKVTPSGGVKNSNTGNYLHVFHLYY